ncbi:uncharacterized protein LOC122881737 [Siniperca chuatsi]|uniref:uncharacterized protein LOC122881737 n=1 Tax=Siniperca chuatsi TaxID=119488 RepID=UPI001CE0BB6C|nr:uncharacterized protein LOC122881737 [Siniperca chuatsi]
MTTIKRAIAEALEDLSENNFLKFCHHLRDRREEPRVRRRAVEGKSFLQITDLLVSTFTEPKALQVTLELLKQINGNEEARILYSKTKGCVDNGDPTFPKTWKGQLETKPSQDALKHAAVQWSLQAAQQHGGPPVKKPEERKAAARACVLSEGGDPRNDRLVLSRFLIQFGKYKGKTFKWLLENDVGYTAMLVANHQKEREHSMRQNPLMANKDSLTQYAMTFRKVSKEVRFHHEYEKAKEFALQSGQEGKALVGFGLHRLERLQDLYESKIPEKISYVNFLRTMKSTCDPGSKMEVAVRYILQRDQEQAAAATNRPTTSFAPQAAPKRPTKRKQVQAIPHPPPPFLLLNKLIKEKENKSGLTHSGSTPTPLKSQFYSGTSN